MRAVLLHEAETEFWASVDYYEEQELGLGVRFKLEVDRFIAKTESDPMQPRFAANVSSGELVRVPPLHRLRGSGRFGLGCRHLPCPPKAEFWMQRLTAR